MTVSHQPALSSIAHAMEAADDAFWTTLAKGLPEIQSSDFSPEAHADWWEAVRLATSRWVRGNLTFLSDDFSADLHERIMEVQVPYVGPAPELPELPAVGAIVRARYDLDMGGHGPWPKGWTGEIVSNEPAGDLISVRAHRYLGPNVHEWDNCRIITLEDGVCAYAQRFDRDPLEDEQPRERVLAYALLNEFEVIG